MKDEIACQEKGVRIHAWQLGQGPSLNVKDPSHGCIGRVIHIESNVPAVGGRIRVFPAAVRHVVGCSCAIPPND